MTRRKTHALRVLAIIGGSLLAILIAVRIAIPFIILHKLNAYLAEFSPDYSIHIRNLHLSFIRCAYRFEGTEAQFKQDGHRFLTVDSAEVTVAWRELLHARVLTDVVVDRASFLLTKKLVNGSQERNAKPVDDASKAADKLFPVDVARVEIHDSEVQFADMIDVSESQQWRISAIEARAFNLTPTTRNPLTFVTLGGTLLGSAPFHVAAQARRLDEPMGFVAQLELHEFDLVAANPLLMRFVPLNFQSGHLDLFAEIKSHGGELEGYVKPFFKKLDVIDVHEKFVGIKHFAIEVVAALGDLILRRHDDKSVAARVPFHGTPKHLKVVVGEVLSTGLHHGYIDPLKPGLENKFELQ